MVADQHPLGIHRAHLAHDIIGHDCIGFNDAASARPHEREFRYGTEVIAAMCALASSCPA